jgi:glycosyltransferase involved in cell wall biosynthesis
MGKVKSHQPKLSKKYYPLVSVCTPTFNRRPFIPIMLECFRNQTYPKDRMEWIIVDDGTDPVGDVIEAADIKQIRYIRSEKHMNLGEKRNYMHTFCKGTIIVYMDDDDYYPPERVQHAVDVLQENRHAMCAGSSEIYVFFKPSNHPLIGSAGKMIQCGPYGPNHATAGTFAFRTELLKQTRYEDGAALAEEKHFLKNYTVPFAQLDPMKSILVFSHNHNTFDKRKLLENPNPQFLKESPKTVDEFIRLEKEAGIKNFFMKDVDSLLDTYEPGKPEMKPNVLDQIKRIEAERMQLQQNEQPQNMIMANINGQERQLNPQEIVNMMNGQIQEIRRLNEENTVLKTRIAELEKEKIMPE